MFGFLKRMFDVNERKRRCDINTLWPLIKKNATDLPHAKVAFGAHAFNDEAWLALPREEIYRRIDELR